MYSVLLYQCALTAPFQEPWSLVIGSKELGGSILTHCAPGRNPSLGTFGQSRLAQEEKASINLLCSLPGLPSEWDAASHSLGSSGKTGREPSKLTDAYLAWASLEWPKVPSEGSAPVYGV